MRRRPAKIQEETGMHEPVTRRRWPAIAIGALLVAVAACNGATGTTGPSPTTSSSGGAATPEPSKAPVALDYWYQSSGPEGLALHEAAVQAYMDANPHVTITLTPYSFDDMQRILPVTLDGKAGPDVASISWGAQGTDLFAKAGHLLDLTDYATTAGWLDSYPADLLAAANQAIEGRIFGIPPEQATVGVYYNADIFKANGISVPTTFAEFEAVLAKLKAAGVTPIATGGGDGWPLAHVWEQLIHTNVPFEHLTALEVDLSPDARYDIPEMLEAASKVLEWSDAGYFNDGMLATAYLDANSLFITGRAAINIGGTWAAPEFATQPEFEARWFPMPRMNASLEWHAGGKAPSDNLVVTSYAEDPEAALAFLGYMLSEENMTRLWEGGKFVTYRFPQVPDPVTPLQGDIYAGMQLTGPGYYMGVNCAEVNRGIWAALQGMIAGDTSAAETLADVQKIYQTDCPKYREGG
jgi:raffinose/stachyose/melibiose transport system substrate-binding protein